MSMICTDHKVACNWKEGVSKAGKAYAFWACPEKDSEGNYCKAEKVDDEQTPAAALAQKARVTAAIAPSYNGNGNGKDPQTQHRIERMHSQEMAIRFAYTMGGDKSLDENGQKDWIKELTDWFLADLEN